MKADYAIRLNSIRSVSNIPLRHLVAKFDVDKVKGVISVPSASLVLSGNAIVGGVAVPFSGSDTVKVVSNSGKK